MNWEGNKGKFHVITIKKFVKLISISFSVPKSRVIIKQKCGFEFFKVIMFFGKTLIREPSINMIVNRALSSLVFLMNIITTSGGQKSSHCHNKDYPQCHPL